MVRDRYPSLLLEQAIDAFAKLPGVGRKTAMRFALHVLRQDEEEVDGFVRAIGTLRHEVKYCRVCHNLSDRDVCDICGDKQRDRGLVCVVEGVRDVMAIESTQQYNGLYHVLGGVISPMEGIGPSDLEIDSLVRRTQEEPVREVILALSSTMEGDTTGYYIWRKLQSTGVRLSIIARGIAVGDELQYTDEVTLGRSIKDRTPFTGVQ